MDRVAEKVFYYSGSLRGPFVVQINAAADCLSFENWLNHCGIEFTETKYEPQKLKRPDLLAYHMRLATFGRVNIGNC